MLTNFTISIKKLNPGMKTYQLIYKALLLVFWPIGSLMDLLGAMQQWRSETGRKSCRNKIIFIDLLMCICIQIKQKIILNYSILRNTPIYLIFNHYNYLHRIYGNKNKSSHNHILYKNTVSHTQDVGPTPGLDEQ